MAGSLRRLASLVLAFFGSLVWGVVAIMAVNMWDPFGMVELCGCATLHGIVLLPAGVVLGLLVGYPLAILGAGMVHTRAAAVVAVAAVSLLPFALVTAVAADPVWRHSGLIAVFEVLGTWGITLPLASQRGASSDKD